MAPRLTAALAAIVVVALGVAWASSLVVTTRSLGTGNAALSACDGDGFTFAYTINTSGQITAVTVTGISATCAGGTMRVTLANGSSNVGAGVASPLGSGGSATVSISPTPLSSVVTANYAEVEGP